MRVAAFSLCQRETAVSYSPRRFTGSIALALMRHAELSTA